MNADLPQVNESFAAALRSSRRHAGRSQLQTALIVGISQRHLSFLESGRARPGRGVVLALGAALGFGVARQNRLLLAAGFAPEFEAGAQSQAEVDLIERAMAAFLDAHEPFPALLLRDGAWIERGNRGAARLWSAVCGAPLEQVPPDNVFELMLRPGARREHLENWSEAAACLLRRYMAEHVQLRQALTRCAGHTARRQSRSQGTVAQRCRHPRRAGGAAALSLRRRAPGPVRRHCRAACAAGYARRTSARRIPGTGRRGDCAVVPRGSPVGLNLVRAAGSTADGNPVETAMTMLVLRKATLADLELVSSWDEQPHVLESDPNDDWGWEQELDREVEWREQLIAEAGGIPIGFVQIIDPAREDSHYWGEIAADLRAIDIWIGEATYLGRGYGTQMMQLALQRCFADARVGAVLIDPLASNVRAQRFYARLGFVALGRRRFGLDDCLVMQLQRADWSARQRG